VGDTIDSRFDSTEALMATASVEPDEPDTYNLL